ncbi:MAG: DoxX family membrane protein [Gilliamella sp.]|nr:DoxX family membrane protein [Gilliamella sp.]MCO6539669.1 DoxX family membrane protein [Gilliamella sp.]
MAFEIAGGALLLLGILTRIISLLTVIQMIVISFIHSTNG